MATTGGDPTAAALVARLTELENALQAARLRLEEDYATR